MAVRIDRTRCNGCGKMIEPACAAVCPGDLLYRDKTGQCDLRDPSDCWDCAACIKECPRQAIKMFLPVEIGGRGSTLTARFTKGMVLWRLNRLDGSSETFKMQVLKKI